jgi:mannose-6-phosphate isomerase-like protein (cupin superfamily)
MGYSKVNVHDLEPAGPGGVVRFVRRELDLLAFGINWFEIPPNADGHQHNEQDSGQEEVNVIVRGSGTYMIDGEEVPIREGDVFRFDPDTTRGPKAGPEGLTMVAVGAPRGSYEPRGSF